MPTEPSTQSRGRTCKRSGLGRAALPVGVSGFKWSWVDSNHRSSPCKGAAFAAGLQDRVFWQWTHRESHPDLQRAELASSCWTMSPTCLLSGRRGTRTPKRLAPPPVFGTGSSSGRMPSVSHKLRGLESNQRPPGSEPGVTTSSNYPGSSWNQRHVVCVAVRVCSSGRRNRTSVSWFKARRPAASRSPIVALSSSFRVPCGNRTRFAGLEARCLCRSAKGTQPKEQV